jgi:hypothetical protein
MTDELTNADVAWMIGCQISILPDTRTPEEAAARLQGTDIERREAWREFWNRNATEQNYWEQPAMTLMERTDAVMARHVRITEEPSTTVRRKEHRGWWLLLAFMIAAMVLKGLEG